jgi:hypothetical protein
MVICEKCFQSYTDEEVPDKCQVCGADLKKPVAAGAAVANVVRPEPLKREPVRREDSLVRPIRREEAPPVRRIPPPEELREAPVQERRSEEARDFPSATRRAEPAPAAEPERPRVFRTVEPIVPLESDDRPLDPRYLETISSFDENEAIVTVIGFSESGKTFFVNRLRNDLAGSWKRKPPPAEAIPVSPQGIELSWFLPMDGKPQAGRNLCYLLLDCAGESFQQALRSQGSSEELKGQSVRAYLSALAFASAFILVIRAEDLLAFSTSDQTNASQGEIEHKRFIRNMLSDFDAIIHAILIAKKRLAKQEAKEFLRQGISRDELQAAFKSSDRCHQPIYIALSLADHLEALQGETYDGDPFLFALEKAPVLFKTIHRSFDNYRFDFLTAFHGHPDREDLDDTAEWMEQNIRPDYHRKCYGAVEAFDWIHALVREQRSGRRRPQRLLLGDVTTRSVVELRRKLDPAFRKAWGKR